MNSSKNGFLILLKKYGTLILAVITALIIIILIIIFSRQYVIEQVEKRVRDTMLEYKAFHQYVQYDMHPAYYELISEGYLPEGFYAPELLSSSYIARNIQIHYNEERQKAGLPEVRYKIAAIDPRNPVNKATSKEENLIVWFNEDHNRQKYREIVEEDGQKFLLVAQPFIEVQPQCLKCHGEPENAPQGLLEKYEWKGAWNLQVGDVIAAEFVRSPLEGEFNMPVILTGGLALLLIGALILLSFNRKLYRLVERRTKVLLKTEELKHELMSSYSTVLSSISDGIIATDYKGNIRVFNHSAEKIFHCSAKDVMGSSIAVFCPEDLRSEQAATIEELKKQGFAQILETERLTFDGIRIPVEISLSLTCSNQEKAECLTASIRDISERKIAEKQLLEKQKLEEDFRQAKRVESIGRLAGGVAHDLNNMLTPVIGFSDLLLHDEGISQTQELWIEQIKQAGIRSRDLVGQLLAFSRKQTLNIKRVDLKTVIRNLESLLKSTIREDIEISYREYREELPVMADYRQLEQVIVNLAINAADAMPEGGYLSISTDLLSLNQTSLPPDLKPGSYAELIISDTGIGIEDEILDQIFEPFFTTKGAKGTGLGLATVYGIIRQHHGNIKVESELKKGTVFRIYLPVCTEKKDFPSQTPASEIIGSDNPSGTETILLVEDDKIVSHLTETILKQNGYNLIIAHKGEKALAFLDREKQKISLIITDVIMPGMNGKELALKVRQKQEDIKVLFMSGYPDNVIAKHGVLEEDLDFIQKPFTKKQLLQKVRQILDRR